MYRLITVPLDGTPFSEHALPAAAALARLAGCRVELVRVVIPPASGTELAGAALLDAERMEALRTHATRELRGAAASAPLAGVEVATTVLVGSVPEALARHVEKSGADLVVMTTHERSRIERVVLGSVAESVVRRTYVPVFLVPEADRGPSLETLPNIEHLLVPLDGSAFAEQVIPHALRLARLTRATVTFLTVVDPDEPRASALSADDSLEPTAGRLRAQGHSIETRTVAGSRPAHAIIRYTKQNGVDVIAMTTHGRGALKQLVAGSVASEVLRTTTLPTLLYRPVVE